MNKCELWMWMENAQCAMWMCNVNVQCGWPVSLVNGSTPTKRCGYFGFDAGGSTNEEPPVGRPEVRTKICIVTPLLISFKSRPRCSSRSFCCYARMFAILQRPAWALASIAHKHPQKENENQGKPIKQCTAREATSIIHQFPKGRNNGEPKKENLSTKSSSFVYLCSALRRYIPPASLAPSFLRITVLLSCGFRPCSAPTRSLTASRKHKTQITISNNL